MKRMKHLLLSALSAACAVTSIFAVTSCSKAKIETEHEHAFTDVVTAPTCTEQGFTTHTCECGEVVVDSYVEASHDLTSHSGKGATCTEKGYKDYETCQREGCDYTTYEETPATGHTCTVEIKSYPSIDVAGEKVVSCKNCTYSESKEIKALVVELPEISSILASVIGAVDVKLEVEEDSNFTYVKEFTTEENGEVVYVSVELAEAVLETAGGLQGHIKFDFKFASKSLEDSEASTDVSDMLKDCSVYAYVNGDAVGFDVVNPDGTSVKETYSLDKLVYTAIAGQMGLTYNEFLEIVYVAKEVSSYAPKLLAMLEEVEIPQISADYIENVATLFALVEDGLVVETKDKKGNTVYTLDVTALKLFIEEIEGKTVGQYINEVYGAGATDKISSFIVSLPGMKVKDIATGAIAIADTYGIDVNEVYDLVNFVAYKMFDVKIEIESEINTRYNLTLLELVGEEASLESVQMAISSGLDAIFAMKIEDVVTMMMASVGGSMNGGDMAEEEMPEPMPYADGDSMPAEDGMFAEMKAWIDMFDSVTTLQFVISEADEIVAINVGMGPAMISYENVDGEYVLVAAAGDVVVSIAADKDAFVFEITDAGEEVATISAAMVDGVCIADVKANVSGKEVDVLDFEASFGETNSTVDFTLRSVSVSQNSSYDETTGEVIKGEATVETFDVLIVSADVTSGEGVLLLETSVSLPMADVEALFNYAEAEGMVAIIANATFPDGSFAAGYNADSTGTNAYVQLETVDFNVVIVYQNDDEGKGILAGAKVLVEEGEEWEFALDATESAASFEFSIYEDELKVASYTFDAEMFEDGSAYYNADCWAQNVNEVDYDDFLDFTAITDEDGILTYVDLVIRGYETYYESQYNETLGTWEDVKVKVFEEQFALTASYTYIHEESYLWETVSAIINGVELTLNYYADEDGANWDLDVINNGEQIGDIYLDVEKVGNECVITGEAKVEGYDHLDLNATVVDGVLEDAEVTFRDLYNVSEESVDEFDRPVTNVTTEEYVCKLTYDKDSGKVTFDLSNYYDVDFTVELMKDGYQYTVKEGEGMLNYSVRILENGICYDIEFVEGEDVMLDATITLTVDEGCVSVAYDIGKAIISDGFDEYVSGAGKVNFLW